MPVFCLWIDHGDSTELVGIYTTEELAEMDGAKIEPKTFISQRILNIGSSIFLEGEEE